jgi:putative DNA primase/helicase
LTKRVIDDIRMQAEASEYDDRAGLLAWATQTESLARRNAMLAGAEAEPSLVITADQLDNDPDLLVVRNGTLDLKTGMLREAHHGDLCSRLAEVNYDPHATAEMWLGHVNLLCNGDPTLAAYIQRAVGYSLTGDVGARSFFFLEGSGSNGKNAFIEPIMALLGSYAQTATSALLTGGDEQHPTILADLLGARLVFIDETRQGKALNVERVKALTGSKRVKARRMKKDFFEFDAQFKLWIAGNGQPTIRDSSDGVWNRMNRIMCHGKVAPERRIDRFGDLLYAEEASGILNWALAGLRSWRETGSLGVPESITRDVQSYRDEEDYVGQFLDDMIRKTGDPKDFLPSASIYTEYSFWAARHGLRGQDLLNASHLARNLAGHGLERHKQVVDRVQTRGFRGVAWLRDRVTHDL